MCKYYYKINDILKNNQWNNEFKIINCIDNDSYYNIIIEYNNKQLEIITDFTPHNSSILAM